MLDEDPCPQVIWALNDLFSPLIIDHLRYSSLPLRSCMQIGQLR